MASSPRVRVDHGVFHENVVIMSCLHSISTNRSTTQLTSSSSSSSSRAARVYMYTCICRRRESRDEEKKIIKNAPKKTYTKLKNFLSLYSFGERHMGDDEHRDLPSTSPEGWNWNWSSALPEHIRDDEEQMLYVRCIRSASEVCSEHLLESLRQQQRRLRRQRGEAGGEGREGDEGEGGEGAPAAAVSFPYPHAYPPRPLRTYSPSTVNLATRTLLMSLVAYGHPGFCGAARSMWEHLEAERPARLNPPERVDLLRLGVLLVELFAWSDHAHEALRHLAPLVDHATELDDGADYTAFCFYGRVWQERLEQRIREQCVMYCHHDTESASASLLLQQQQQQQWWWWWWCEGGQSSQEQGVAIDGRGSSSSNEEVVMPSQHPYSFLPDEVFSATAASAG